MQHVQLAELYARRTHLISEYNTLSDEHGDDDPVVQLLSTDINDLDAQIEGIELEILHDGLLKFTHGNAKLSKDTMTWSLLSGRTCPAAHKCKAFAVRHEGKTSLRRGNASVEAEDGFGCFSAADEARYPNVFEARSMNTRRVITTLRESGPGGLSKLIVESIKAQRKSYTKKVRVHVGGDFFSELYLDAWLDAMQEFPELQFYAYSKSLHLWKPYVEQDRLPENFTLVASYGGKYDYMIDEGIFPVYAKVYFNFEDARADSVFIDYNEDRVFMGQPFGLLIHGTQNKGSKAADALKALKADGYSGDNRKVMIQQYNASLELATV
jgi:hypothetical protein